MVKTTIRLKKMEIKNEAFGNPRPSKEHKRKIIQTKRRLILQMTIRKNLFHNKRLLENIKQKSVLSVFLIQFVLLPHLQN